MTGKCLPDNVIGYPPCKLLMCHLTARTQRPAPARAGWVLYLDYSGSAADCLATREMLTVLQTAQDEYHILCAAHSPESFNLRGKKNVSCIFYIVCNILLICCLFFWGWLFNPMILILRFSKWQHTHEKQTDTRTALTLRTHQVSSSLHEDSPGYF